MGIELPAEVFDKVSQVMGVAPDGTIVLTLVRLGTLTCKETEDWTGADEVYVRIQADQLFNHLDPVTITAVETAFDDVARDNFIRPNWLGAQPGTTIKVTVGSLNDDQSRDVGWTVPLLTGRSFGIEVWDEDGPHEVDSDDLLGSATVSHGAIPTTVSFTGDDANYELALTVETVPVIVRAAGHGHIPIIPGGRDLIGDLVPGGDGGNGGVLDNIPIPLPPVPGL